MTEYTVNMDIFIIIGGICFVMVYLAGKLRTNKHG